MHSEENIFIILDCEIFFYSRNEHELSLELHNRTHYLLSTTELSPLARVKPVQPVYQPVY
ncbi:hypothetical protein P175DRAFT_0504479 [Aspergillus ochraceoroseus IBT 24754]|uniref:Uncharacterized protein n=1 Tax=Aspergillus ochraceoroseus IBT 24754 TaxID=1392256 RepID=A0A2T5LN77_9EURO|nr:uncharacterized protein P175DRAFT_0504479 [Aspergillus ochraceoroseus IBT 24754]PTU17738.1 hypothetical protein P175DRAFT_0504479 [Aspergillus ochraceoroseus IBT 24754]